MHATRFQIEDILSQDEHGVVFLARDVETDKEVLLQRFFPFGVGSGGLEKEDQASFCAAVEHMRSWQHPSLRRLIDGGCDPVDGIPFLVMQAPESENLAAFFSHGPLSMTQGRQLAEQALLVMLELERIYGTGGGWLIFQAEHVEVFDEGMRYRFGVDPMKWIGARRSGSHMRELTGMVENAMGWSGRVVAGSTMGSISGWIRMMRTQDYSVTQSLSLLRGENPHDPSPALTVQQTHVMPTKQMKAYAPTVSPLPSLHRQSHLQWIIAVVLLVLGAAAFFIVQYANLTDDPKVADTSIKQTNSNPQNHPQPTTSGAPSAPANDHAAPLSDEDQQRKRIEMMAQEMQKKLNGESETEEEIAKTPAEPLREGDYKPSELELVRQQKGNTVTLLGKVSLVRMSQSGKSLYIEFEGDPAQQVCGRYLTQNGKAGMSVSELASLEGKTVRLKGEVQLEIGTKRVMVNLIERDQIEEVP